MPLDIYIYLKGGRGDGFVPDWNGVDPMEAEEGTLTDGEGLEVSEPYRDIFPAETNVGIRATYTDAGETHTGRGTMPMKTAFLPGDELALEAGWSGPVIAGITQWASIYALDPKFTTSDEVAHTAPRQFTKVCTWLVFTSVGEPGSEYPFKFRKADVIGWGTRPRTD